MRTVTKNIFNYSELSDIAKEKAKEWYINNIDRTHDFELMIKNDLLNLFETELDVQFSLSCCQGDGFNVYGNIEAYKILECLEKHNAGEQLEEFENVLTEKEKRTILYYAEECGKINLEYNHNYSYSLATYINIVEDWEYQLTEYSMWKNINTNVLKKFENMVREIFEKLCKDYEKQGYEYFYNIDDEELTEACECNNWEFEEDGTRYVA